jgi:hypothetical protein
MVTARPRARREGPAGDGAKKRLWEEVSAIWPPWIREEGERGARFSSPCPGKGFFPIFFCALRVFVEASRV